MVERLPGEKEKADEILRELDEPLPWQDADSQSSVDVESESFMAMMARSQ